jgi:hypothetical protein
VPRWGYFSASAGTTLRLPGRDLKGRDLKGRDLKGSERVTRSARDAAAARRYLSAEVMLG